MLGCFLCPLSFHHLQASVQRSPSQRETWQSCMVPLPCPSSMVLNTLPTLILPFSQGMWTTCCLGAWDEIQFLGRCCEMPPSVPLLAQGRWGNHSIQRGKSHVPIELTDPSLLSKIFIPPLFHKSCFYKNLTKISKTETCRRGKRKREIHRGSCSKKLKCTNRKGQEGGWITIIPLSCYPSVGAVCILSW